MTEEKPSLYEIFAIVVMAVVSVYIVLKVIFL
jgi:hypothetical protein